MKKVILLLVIAAHFFAVNAQQWYTTNSFNYRDINGAYLFNKLSMVTVGGNFTLDSIQSISTTQNSGLTWNAISDNVTSWVVSLDFADSTTGLTVGTNGKILKTTNGGSSWSALASPVNRDFNKVLYTGTQTAIVAGGRAYPAQGTIIKTINGGASWSVVYDVAGPVLRSVAFTNSTTGYAVGDSGVILRTSNGGSSWSAVSAPLLRNYYSVWFADANTGVIVGGDATQRTILRTNDGGNNWNTVLDEAGATLRDVHFFSVDSGYAVGGNATMFSTVDGGLNWLPVTVANAPSNSQFNAVRFLSGDYGVVCATAGNLFLYAKSALAEVYTTNTQLSNTTNVDLYGLTNTHGYPAYYTYTVADNINFTNPTTTFAKPITAGALIPANEFVYGLNANTRYYTYLEVRTYAGSVTGDVISFYTGTSNQQFTTQPAVNITANTAQLKGLVSGYSYPVNLNFEYGLTPALGTSVAALPAQVSDTSVHDISASVGSLQPASLYYYRLKGTSAQGNFTGNLQLFTTTGYTPYVTIKADSVFAIAANTASVSGTVKGFTVAPQLYYDYSTQPNFWSSVSASPQSVTDTLQHTVLGQLFGLQGSTTYYVRLKAITSLGEYYSDTLSFTTPADPIMLKTRPATGINANSATINAVTRNTGEALTFTFQYGTTTALGTDVAALPGTTSDTLIHNLTVDLTGLQPATIYYYRIRSANSQNVYSYGDIRQFYTFPNTIPNWDFSNWTASNVTVPYNWRYEGAANGVQRVAGHTGNYAMQVSGETFAIMGKIRSSQAGDGPDFFDPLPFNYRPDSIIFYSNFNIHAGDTAIMLVVMYSQGNQISNGFYPVLTGNSNGAFQRVAVKLNYNSSAIPDSILLGIIPTNALSGQPMQNNTVVIDDISFSPAGAPALNNAGFENWVTFTKTMPDHWRTFNTVGYNFSDNSYKPMVVQATSVNAGDIAAEVRTLDLDSGVSFFEGSLSSESGIFNEGPSVPVFIRHQTLNGYYKYNRVGDDQMTINVKMFQHGQNVGYGQLAVAQSVPDFTMFDIPINYYNQNAVPDSVAIGISASKNYPAGASVLTVDKFGFDGFYDTAFVYTGIRGVEQNLPVQSFNFTLYPNPAQNMVTISLPQVDVATLDMYTITGKLLQTHTIFQGNTILPLSGYGSGIYLVKVTAAGHSLVKRLLILEGN